MSGFIYRIYSTQGNCCYIGKTTKPKVSYRYNQHLYEFKKKRYYYTSYEVLQHLDHEIEVLEENIPIDELLERERYYMRHFDNIVNLSGTKYN